MQKHEFWFILSGIFLFFWVYTIYYKIETYNKINHVQQQHNLNHYYEQLYISDDLNFQSHNITSTVKQCFSVNFDSSWFTSQLSEDRHLMLFFQNYCNGVYVELGALDGLTYSNTYVFHKALNWKGILVELSPKNYEKLKQNRPNEIELLNAAVCSQKSVVHFIEANAVGGVWEFTAEKFREAWWGKHTKIQDATPIQCLPLSQIFSKFSNNFFADILSLDVEGSELDVLNSIDFKAAAFGVILVESDSMNISKNVAVRNLLSKKGYIFLYWYQHSDWFINVNFQYIYPLFREMHVLL